MAHAPRARRGRRSRRGPALIAVTAAAGLGLMAPALADGATVTLPANQTFDANASGWSRAVAAPSSPACSTRRRPAPTVSRPPACSTF